MKLRSILLALLVSGTTLFTPPAYSGNNTLCCTDHSGRRVCGDMLPQECYGRAYREVDSRGNILRHIEAPMTTEQIAQRDAKLQRQKEEEHAAMEQKRKDQALLNTYASESDIEFMRSRALAEVEAVAKDVRNKLSDDLKQKKKLDGELEFYKKRPVPPSLKEQIKSTDTDIKAQQNAIDATTKDKEMVNSRFDEDKKRYLELTHGGKSTAIPAPAAPAETRSH